MREMTPEEEARLRAKAEKHVGVVSKLSPMQRTFLVEYLVTSNATQAAETAGYANPNSQGSRLLTYDKIQAAISEYFFGPEMTAKEVIQRLGQQGRAEYAAYLIEREVPVLDKEGELVGHRYETGVDFERLMADDKGHLVKGVKNTRYGPAIEFYDAQSALVHVGRYRGLFGPSGSVDDPAHSVGWSVEEWRVERDRRRKEAAEVEELFEEDTAAADGRSAELGGSVEGDGLAAED